MLDWTCLSHVLKQQLGMYSSSSTFDYNFDTRIILAAVNETELEAISDADQPTQQTSAEDEDPNDEVVNDPHVIAEVKLPSTIRKFDLFTITFPSPCC